MAEAKGLFAGVAGGLPRVGTGGLVEGLDEALGDAVDLGNGAEAGGVDREEELGEAGLSKRVGRDLMGGAAAGEGSGEEVEDQGETGALPEADWEGAKGLLDGPGVGGEIAFSVVTAGDGEGLAPAGIVGELAVGELAHGGVEDDVRAAAGGAVRTRAGDGDDEGVVAKGGDGCAPGGEVTACVGPAYGEQTLVGGLPSVGAAAHPVVRMGEGDGSDAVLAGESDGAGHGVLGVEIADAEVSGPALDAPGRDEQVGGGVDVDAAVAHHGGEAWEAIETVGLDTIAGAFGEDAGAAAGTVGGKTESEAGFGEGVDEVREGDARHGWMVLLWKLRVGLGVR